MKLLASVFFALTAICFQLSPVHAQTQLVPRLVLEQQFIENKTASQDQSGNVTRISPGIQYLAESSMTSISLDYSLNAIYSSGLSQNDQVNRNLNMTNLFTHIPNRWFSEITGNISQANISTDGLQLVNPNFQNENTRELRTFGVNTNLNGGVTETIQYSTNLGADYADYEGSDKTNGYFAKLSLDNFKTRENFSWLLGINTRISETDADKQTINTSNLNLNYKFNTRLSSFVDLSKTQTDDNVLNDSTATLIGLKWASGRNTMIKIGAGKRDDEDSYTLDVSHKKRNLTLTANYDEVVSTARDTTLSQLAPDMYYSGTTQSLSITPMLEKRTAINMLLTGKHSGISFTIFETDRSQQGLTQNETIRGAKLVFSRKLSARSDLSLSLLSQQSETTQDNDLTDIEATYKRILSKSISMSAGLGKTRQSSTELTNEYRQTEVGILLTASF